MVLPTFLFRASYSDPKIELGQEGRVAWLHSSSRVRSFGARARPIGWHSASVLGAQVKADVMG